MVGGASSDNHLGGHGEGVDYEVPENIKTLHHLALQYVNQVCILLQVHTHVASTGLDLTCKY